MFRTISYDVIALYSPSLFFYLSCVVVNLPVANRIIGIKSSVENRGIVATNLCFLSFSDLLGITHLVVMFRFV